MGRPMLAATTPTLALLAALLAAPAAPADLTPQWLRRVPTSPSWHSGLTGIVVDGAGTTYAVGQTGDSNNSDILVTAIDAEGTQLWQRTWDGPEGWHDQARGITLGGLPRPTPEESRAYTERAFAAALAGRLRPLIGQRFPLARAADAHAAIEARVTIGKTLLEVG